MSLRLPEPQFPDVILLLLGWRIPVPGGGGWVLDPGLGVTPAHLEI